MQPRPQAASAAKEAALCWALAHCPEEVTQPRGSPWFAGLDAEKGQATGTSAYWPLVPAEGFQGWMQSNRTGRSREKSSLELTFCGLALKSITSATWEVMKA